MSMRFFEYDFDEGKGYEYRRLGECHRCGACCRQRIAFMVIKPGYYDHARNGNGYIDGKGLWNVVNRGRWRYCYKFDPIEPGEPCTELDGSRCTIHGRTPKGKKARQPYFTLLCRDWPLGPHAIIPGDVCGFRFELIQTWVLEGAGE